MKIIQPSVLIRISRSWYDGISDQELYEVTRGVWKIGERRERVELAFAVAGSAVREVYGCCHGTRQAPLRTIRGLSAMFASMGAGSLRARLLKSLKAKGTRVWMYQDTL